MKFLFILDGVDFPHAVNPQLARRLAGELTGMGHTAEILQLWDGFTAIPPSPTGVEVHALPFADEHLMNLALENGRKNGSPTPLRLARLACHPTAVLAAFRQLVLHRNRRQTACTRELERLNAQRNYDAVVAVCAPYYAAFALAEANISAQKITWQMDPYSANQEYTPYGGSALENKMYEAMSRVFITRLMEKDYLPGTPLEAAQPKTKVLEFPCLVPGNTAEATAHKGIKVVFAGNLHPDIRKPWFALELFAALNAPDVTLELAGGGWEAFETERLNDFRRKLGARLVIPGSLPPEKAREEMAGADILLNLGNGVANQLPSKIFDYFGMGKPILNLCVRDDDPVLGYFARWPLALTLRETDGFGADTCRKLEDFLRSASGKQIPFTETEVLFRENTPAAVAAAFLESISTKE